MPKPRDTDAIQQLENIILLSQDHQQLINNDDWDALDSALAERQDKLTTLFKENPRLADNPIIAEKIQLLLSLDQQHAQAVQQLRDQSDNEIGTLKRNVQSLKNYIDINESSEE
jgi:hypothetical protein